MYTSSSCCLFPAAHIYIYIFCHSNIYLVIPHCGFNLHLIIMWSIFWCAVCHLSYLVKYFFKLLPIFKLVFVYWVLRAVSVWIDIFFLSEYVFCIFLVLSFKSVLKKQNLKNFGEIQFIIFSFIDHTFDVSSNRYLIHINKDFLI